VTKQLLFVSVHPDGSDLWRLDPVVDIIKKGGVGIIPTDTLPAVVCDLENKNAIRRLYLVKHMNPKKPLSLLCRGFPDIGTYTTGFPVSNEPGVPNMFNIAKEILPGPYTLILNASKQLPKQLVDYETNKVRRRRSVGVRWPKDVICQAILDSVGRPLIASSMHIEHDEDEDFELPNGVTLMETYSSSGIDFVVNVGQRMVQESTVIDMTDREPAIVREGSGDTSLFKRILSS